MFLVIMPVIIPFFQDRGLTMQEILELQAWFAFVIVVLEIPSGYLADLWGRKRTLVVGALFTGLGFSLLPIVHTLFEFFVYETLLAISLSLISGADVSILYDSYYETSTENINTSRLIGNFHFSKSLGESLAALVGGVLVLYSFEHVVWGTVIVGWISFLVALTIREPKRAQTDSQSHWENIKQLKDIFVNGEPILKWASINFLFWAMVTYTMAWIFQKYWTAQEVPLAYFGFLWAGFNLTVALGAKLSHWTESRFGFVATLLIIPLLEMGGLLGMALSTAWIGVSLGLLINLGRGFGTSILKNAVNTRIASKFRATVNSMLSFGVRSLFILVGPLMGWWIDNKGINYALIGLFSLCSLAFVFLMIPLLRSATRSNS